MHQGLRFDAPARTGPRCRRLTLPGCPANIDDAAMMGSSPSTSLAQLLAIHGG